MLTPSTAAISWAVPSTARRWDARNHRQLLVQRLARVGSDEGFELTINRPDAVALVDASGWVVTEQTGMRGAARAITSRALVPPDSGLPVDAIDHNRCWPDCVPEHSIVYSLDHEKRLS